MMDCRKYRIDHLSFVFPFLLFLCLLPSSSIYAQCDDEKSSDGLSWDFDEAPSGSFSLGKFLANTFTLQIVTDSRHIRAYILDERFQVLRARCGDMRAVDAIYLKALKIADYHIARALFLSLMAVLEHRKVVVKVPVFSSIEVPLTLEEDSIFFARIQHLPNRLYPDTPAGKDGDRDKLQHFFGSAYLAYSSEAPEFTRSAGDLVEWGEAKMVVGGVDDQRDKRANKQGESFGRDLLIVKTLLPSDYLTFQDEGRK